MVNNTVYTVGDYRTGSYKGEYNYPTCYWVGTERTDHPVPAGASGTWATGIAVVNNTVYTAGLYYDSNNNFGACYWAGTERTDLPVPAGAKWEDLLFYITVVNNTVYTAGGYYEDGNDLNWRACYWAGTERTDLPVPAGASWYEVRGIAVVAK